LLSLKDNHIELQALFQKGIIFTAMASNITVTFIAISPFGRIYRIALSVSFLPNSYQGSLELTLHIL
jgi:hypothetical protein